MTFLPRLAKSLASVYAPSRAFCSAALRAAPFSHVTDAQEAHRRQHRGYMPATPTPPFHGRLVAQAFSGNVLIRGGHDSLDQVLEQQAAAGSAVPPQFMLVAERRVCVAGPAGSSAAAAAAAAVRWFDLPGLQQLLQLSREPGAEQFRLQAGDGRSGAVDVPMYMLGHDAAGGYKLAADVSAVPQPRLDQANLAFQELRSLLPLLEPGQLSIAGHAVALSQWHQGHQFCARCGAPTVLTEGGVRRQCTVHQGHRAYPRTDPVVIMLVESPDGSCALFGRSKKVRLPLYTCLAGFIDQGESMEEAVAREVREESGAEVTHVDILGSQPWPIGRGGSCELMIGCIARARTTELHIDTEEMEDVRWVPRAEVLASVAAASSPANPYSGGRGCSGEGAVQPPYWIPPPFAIAHYLIKAWADRGGPWFPQAQQEEEQQLQQGGQGPSGRLPAASNL